MSRSSDISIEDGIVSAIDMNDAEIAWGKIHSRSGTVNEERLEKNIMNDSVYDDSADAIFSVIGKIKRRLKEGKKVIPLSELNRYDISTDIVRKLALLSVQLCGGFHARQTNRNSTIGTNVTNSSDNLEYEEDFEEEVEDDVPALRSGSRGIAPSVSSSVEIIRKELPPRKPVSALSSMRRSARQNTGWIQNNQWRIGEKIGSGSFGEVFQGLNESNGKLFAVKRLNMIGKRDELDGLMLEIDLMRQLCHEHIVQYLGAKVDEDQACVFIFQEWVPGGSVAHLLKRFGRFKLGIVRNYTRQILKGLMYLHANGIIHRDIKGGNILVDDNGLVKLADFGASSKMTMGRTQDGSSIKGTPYFMAPEVLSQSKYGRKGDIWAVGCTIIQMLTGEPPWKDRNVENLVQLHMLLSTMQGPPPYTVYSRDSEDAEEEEQQLRVCLERCFEKRPEDRPYADELSLCEFLREDELEDSLPLEDSSTDRLSSTMDELKSQMEKIVFAKNAPEAIVTPRSTTGATTALIEEQIMRHKKMKAAGLVNPSYEDPLLPNGAKFSPPLGAHKNPCSPDNPFGKLFSQSSAESAAPKNVNGNALRQSNSADDSEAKKHLLTLKKRVENPMRASGSRRSFSRLPEMQQSSAKDDDATPVLGDMNDMSLIRYDEDEYFHESKRESVSAPDRSVRSVTNRSASSGRMRGERTTLRSQTGAYAVGSIKTLTLHPAAGPAGGKRQTRQFTPEGKRPVQHVATEVKRPSLRNHSPREDDVSGDRVPEMAATDVWYCQRCGRSNLPADGGCLGCATKRGFSGARDAEAKVLSPPSIGTAATNKWSR